MAFLSLITITGDINTGNLSQQLFDKQREKAEQQFDEALKIEVISQLKKNNIIVSEQDFDQYVAEHISKITNTDSNTTIIALDAVIDAGTGDITDIGIILAQYREPGYYVTAQNPSSSITMF